MVDSGSVDGTVEMSKKLGANVIFNKWDGYGKQKRFGEKNCKNDWVLNLDGDEIISSELKYEIRSLFDENITDNFNLFYIKRQNVFPFGRNPYSWSGDKVIRLYNKSVARYPDHPTWDKIKKPKNEPVKYLNGVIYHYWMKDFEHQINTQSSVGTEVPAGNARANLANIGPEAIGVSESCDHFVTFVETSWSLCWIHLRFLSVVDPTEPSKPTLTERRSERRGPDFLRRERATVDPEMGLEVDRGRAEGIDQNHRWRFVEDGVVVAQHVHDQVLRVAD